MFLQARTCIVNIFIALKLQFAARGESLDGRVSNMDGGRLDNHTKRAEYSGGRVLCSWEYLCMILTPGAAH